MSALALFRVVMATIATVMATIGFAEHNAVVWVCGSLGVVFALLSWAAGQQAKLYGQLAAQSREHAAQWRQMRRDIEDDRARVGEWIG